MLPLAHGSWRQSGLGFVAVTKRNAGAHNGVLFEQVLPMPVIRFVREGRDVECYPGENLRDVALREGVELYGLKGRLGNCNGCGQCITCFVEIPNSNGSDALTPRTSVEEAKLKRRPNEWRLACQTLVQRSVVVLTKPQSGLSDRDGKVAAALAQELPAGPVAWPVVEEPEAEDQTDEELPGGQERQREAATPDDEA